MDVSDYTKQGIQAFIDKDGNSFTLTLKAFKHIRYDNCIDDPPAFINDVFANTIAIVSDKTSPTRLLYFSEVKRGRLYKTVIADLSDKRIKTAFLSNKIKGGKPKWVSRNLMS